MPSTLPEVTSAPAPAIVPLLDKGNRVWFVPLPVRLKSLDGNHTGPRNGVAGWAGEEQLLAAGPALDVIWSSRHVLFSQEDNGVREVFNATTAARR